MTMLPDQFTPVAGPKVKVVLYDILHLGEDYAVTPLVMSVLRDLARDTDILVEHSADTLSEVSLTDKRMEDALIKTDADLLIFGSYMATRSNVQPLIHFLCTYGRPLEQSAALPEGMDLNQAVEEGDAILQLPRHVLSRDLLPLLAVETLTYQNNLAQEVFGIARFIQALKLYKDGKFEETVLAVNKILDQFGEAEQWPNFWAPYNYLHMLSGLAYLRLGNGEAAVYTLSNAIERSSPARLRVMRAAEQIISSLMSARQAAVEEAAPEEAAPAQGEEPAPPETTKPE